MKTIFQTNNNENISKPVAAKPLASKRRALGDITNAYGEDDSHEVLSKKPQFSLAQSEPVTARDFQPAADLSRDYMRRPCDDIDSRDNDNPLLVTCYVNEMYDHFRELENEFKVNHNYMAKQEYINDKMRSILVDWLVDVHLKFKMVPESLYITIQIIDRYLSHKGNSIRRSKLQLVGVAALLVRVHINSL